LGILYIHEERTPANKNVALFCLTPWNRFENIGLVSSVVLAAWTFSCVLGLILSPDNFLTDVHCHSAGGTDVAYLTIACSFNCQPAKESRGALFLKFEAI
jgi:hypothetical protein